MTPPHVCHADGCDVRVPRKMFMCKRHWYALPKHLRDAIWREYNAGQERGVAPVTREYISVAREAIAWLASREGQSA